MKKINNNKYFERVKAKLIELGQETSDIDQKVSALISYADKKNINVIKLLEEGIDFDKLDKNAVDVINEMRPKTSFVTKRVSEVPPSKFVRRTIIE